MSKPSINDYPVYFQKYIDLVPEEDLLTAFEKQLPVIDALLSGISEERSLYAYAAGKWTLKEVLQHMIDTERIFSYRALSFARKETASLPGFEENDYAANSNANSRSWQSMVDEFKAVRASSTLLFKSFDAETLTHIGKANNNPTSVLAVGYMTVGHFYHHKNIMEERYS